MRVFLPPLTRTGSGGFGRIGDARGTQDLTRGLKRRHKVKVVMQINQFLPRFGAERELHAPRRARQFQEHD